MRQLLPFPADNVVPYDVYRPDEGRARLLRLNMIASVDGRATDREGVTAELGSEGDQELFRTLRALADGVLVGAATVRVEGYGPHRLRADLAERRRRDGRPDPAAIIVVSRSLDLDPQSPMFTEARTPTIVLTCAAAPADRRAALAGAEIIVAGEDSVDLRTAFDELVARYDIRHVLCEGGPTLNRSLLEARLVDELCLTITPQMTGRSALAIVRPPAPAADLDLRGLCEQDGELYARYQVQVRPDER
ncbi:MAG TPA: dihydrofolate reductase family protein [Euzebyales bacterium]|nr:dihydrofolate reductase family protein [Euzebyales bacterium]